MAHDYDTPAGIEPSSEGVHDWIKWQFLKLHDRTKTISKRIDDLCLNVSELEHFQHDAEVRLALGAERFNSLSVQIEDLKKSRKNPNGNGSDKISFKWLLEKFALPIVMLLIGGAVALLFKGGP